VPEAMTPRQRMLTALRHGVPDIVPVCPDISNMIPCRLTGKPYWEIYVFNNPGLGEAYLEAARRLGIEVWYLYGYVPGGNRQFPLDLDLVEPLVYDNITVPKELVRKEILERSEEKLVEQVTVETPLGELETTSVYMREAPPWDVTNFIKDIDRDWPRLKWLIGEDWHWGDQCVEYEKVGDSGVYGLQVHTFVDWWDGVRSGTSERLILDFYDYPRQMEEIYNFFRVFTLSRVHGLIEAGVDEVLVQGSNSSMSLINPQIYKEFVLPLNIEISMLCRKRGTIAHLHTCGRSRQVVEWNAEQAFFDVIEPLEKPPSGDVDLAEVKRKYGQKVALKGNLLTSGNLLLGTPADVEREVVETLQAGAEGGGFILSTGDQVGGNTPLENLEAMIEAGRKYGTYTDDGRLAAF